MSRLLNTKDDAHAGFFFESAVARTSVEDAIVLQGRTVLAEWCEARRAPRAPRHELTGLRTQVCAYPKFQDSGISGTLRIF